MLLPNLTYNNNKKTAPYRTANTVGYGQILILITHLKVKIKRLRIQDPGCVLTLPRGCTSINATIPTPYLAQSEVLVIVILPNNWCT